MSEAQIVAAILKYLKGLEGCRARKHHADEFSIGEPDIDACYRGRSLKLEVKLPGGRPSEVQARVLEQWQKAGAVAAVVTSVEDVRSLIETTYGEER